jgi:hypothetical protein
MWLIDAQYPSSIWNSTSTFLNFIFLQIGTNPNLVMFGKFYMDMDTMTWCKWKNVILGYFDSWTLQTQNKIKLNVKNNPCLGTCLINDIFIIVHSKFTLKSNMTTIGFMGPFGWD